MIRYLILLAPLLMLASCALSPEKQETFLAVFNTMLENQQITQEQYDYLVKLVQGSSDWWQYPVTALISIVLSYLGINSNIPLIGRGAKTQVVGLPASKVVAGS